VDPKKQPPGAVTVRSRSRLRAVRGAALLAAAAVLAAGTAGTAQAASGRAPTPPRTTTPADPRQPAAADQPAAAHHPADPRPAVAARPVAAPRPGVRHPGGRPGLSPACPTDLGRIACVDLTRQRMWVQIGARVVFGPVPVRTGRRGHVTRDGLWHVYLRSRDQWSRPYDVAMPYSQFFSGGEAFHGLDGESMDAPPGSHGCVNMNTWDARKLWGVLRVGDPVEVFGHKQGI
jgi:lipoprotein-anchoring transpeptidase ErfK/SrfK